MIHNLKKINLISLLLITALTSLWGAIVYRLYALNDLGIIIALILAIISFIIIHRFCPADKLKADWPKKNPTGKKRAANGIFLVLYLLSLALCFFILFKNRAIGSIISPWQALPGYFFLIYSLATALLITNLITGQKSFSLILISLHYFLSFSVAVIIYKLGYGFDPFIHEATVNLIAETGAVAPKPFYYLGQYSLIVIIHKLTALPIVWLDRLLIPALAALTLPLALYKALNKWFEDSRSVNLSILFLLAIPFSIFIVTTPQNLAWLFLILVIILGLVCDNYFELLTIYALALAALATQPIAGVPAILFAVLLTVYHLDNKNIKRHLYFLIFLLTVLTLPLAFYILENGSLAQTLNQGAPDVLSEPLTESGQTQPAIASLFKPINPNSENFILNFVYLYAFNIKFILGFVIFSGLFIAYRFREQTRITRLYLLIGFGLFISFLLARRLAFAFLINYERSNYTDRILIASALFLLPFVLFAVYGFINKLKDKNNIIIALFGVFGALVITASLYISYPRFDNYHNSHIYSVGQADIDAVRWIDANASGDYIVLANQQVSAAALREFGFKKYYQSEIGNQKSEIFYYPIPTGGPLYQYYLKMVYEYPAKDTIIDAMNLTGAGEAYFVLNKYWWAFPKILEEAKLEADSCQEINNGNIYVFSYIK